LALWWSLNKKQTSQTSDFQSLQDFGSLKSGSLPYFGVKMKPLKNAFLIFFIVFATTGLIYRTIDFAKESPQDKKGKKGLAETMGFEVAHSIPLSRLFSGHRYVALRKKTPGRAAT
jgi:hypothetical protein